MKATIVKPWLKYYDAEKLKMQIPELSIVDYLLWRNKDRMQMNALNYFDRNISLQEMYDNSLKTANAYAALGVKENDIVVVCSATTPEIVYTFYGLSLIGAIPNMIDPRYSAEGIREVIDEVDSHFVVTLDVAYDKVVEAVKGTNVEKVVVLSPAESLPPVKKFAYLKLKSPKVKNLPENFVDWADFFEAGKDHKVEYIHDRADRCCVIVHTGGTTGKSKSVMLSDRNINSIHFQYYKGLMANTTSHGKDKFLNVMPPFIAYGLGYGVHLPIASGMTSVIIPQLEPKELAKLVMKHKPQDIAGVPAHIQVMIEDRRMRKADLSFFKNCCVGGDSIPVPAEEKVNEFLKAHGAKYPLTKGYGMTELAAVTTACMLDVNRVGSVGVPHADFLIAAFDPESGEELELGQTGEICVHGPTTMIGYYNNQTETDNIVRTHADGLKWVHTGDYGYMDEDGFVYIKGRIKRVIIRVDGFKVYPTIIEDVLSKCEKVSACAVVGMRDEKEIQGQVPCAFVALKPGCDAAEAEAELRELCRRDLAEYQQPAAIRIVDELPYTSIGKVDFRKLEEIALEKASVLR